MWDGWPSARPASPRLRSRLRRIDARQRDPGVLDRWLARPPRFALLIVLGSVAVMATYDTPRTAPLVRTSIPAGGALLAWIGAMAARAYVEQRWPRAKGSARLAWFLMGVIFVAITFTCFDRAVSLVSMQMGVYAILQAVLETLSGHKAS